MYIIFVFIVGVIILATLYLNFNPQSGGKVIDIVSGNFNNGRFQNLVDTPLSTGDKSMMVSMYEFFFQKHPEAFPLRAIKTEKIDRELLENLSDDDIAISWLGHSTALIKTKDVTIVTDPLFNGKNLPPMYMGPKKFPYTNDYDVSDLSKIDVVLISHDHYDHLDMGSVLKLKDSRFYVPLGVKYHLLRWGIEESNITELDWYSGAEYKENIKFTLAPTRHFSGRGLFNRNKTLWGSWVIKAGDRSIYFGGDSGYFEEFKKIGEEYGPFDLALLDVGQYDLSWQGVHMLPSEAAQAGVDLGAKSILPIHNSKYILAKHSWYEPLEKATEEANKQNINITTPRIGQTFLVDDDMPNERWWENR